MLDFNASFNKLTNSTDLIWQAVYDDYEDEGFEVLRSWDGKEFHSLDFIPVQGELDQQATYNYHDNTVTNFGQIQAFYRLKVIQADGEIFYSSITRVVLPAIGADIKVYPNPTADQSFRVDISGATTLPTMEITSAEGKLVTRIQLRSFSQSVHLSGLPPGIYLLRFFSQELTIYKRLIMF